MAKRILIYNWTQFDYDNLRGGGVSVYIKNIIPAMLDRGHRVFFLGSGHRYSLRSRDIFVRPTKNIFGARGVESHEIVNSPIKAPAHDAFGNISQCLNSPELTDVFAGFVKEHSINEVHIHNVEGISTDLIESLSTQLNVTVKIWLHNYHWVCPQIELFQDSKRMCHDFQDGQACVGCLGNLSHMDTLKKYQGFGDFLERVGLAGKPLGNLIFDLAGVGKGVFGALKSFYYASKSWVRSRGKEPSREHFQRNLENQTNQLHGIRGWAGGYRAWREENVRRLNQYADQMYAVSEIVKQRHVALGVDASKIKTTPIGMPSLAAKELSEIVHKKEWSGRLRLGFFGYPIPSKGLEFMIDSMLKLDDNYKDKVALTVVSTVSDVIRRRLTRLGEHTKVLEGYQREDMREILSDIDVVVVPSIWWETYNQVTYEAIQYGVPVLISDSVGISYVIENEGFKFASGNAESFIQRLEALLDQKVSLGSFWEQAPQLCTYDEHVNAVLGQAE